MRITKKSYFFREIKKFVKFVHSWFIFRENKICLGIPAKVIKIDGKMANVQVRGTEVNAKPEVKEGEYVILYAGFAIQVLDENEAIQNYKNGGDSKVKFRVDLG